MASDLRYCGYKRIDVLRIYGFNLILMPVNLAGFLNSLVQALTGEKSVFGRTPKVANRTVPDFIFVISPWLLTGAGRLDALAGLDLPPLDQLRLRRAEHGARALRDRRLHRHPQLGRRLPHPRQGAGSPFRSSRKPKAQTKRARRLARRAAAEVQTAPPADWASVLHFGNDPHGGRRVLQGRNAAAGCRRRAAGSAHAVELDGARPVRRSARRTPRSLTFRTVFQPIVELGTGHVAGREALTRFDDGVAPHQRLAEESSRGGGLELEILLARASVQAAADFPSDEWLGLNVSLGAGARRPCAARHHRARPCVRWCSSSTPGC